MHLYIDRIVVRMLALALLCSSCGTQVDTGRNKTRRPKKNIRPTESMDHISSDSCFGTSPEMPGIVERYCSSLMQHNGKGFEKLSGLLCEKKKLFNLFLSECGWSGVSNNPVEFVYPFEHTALDDQSTNIFHYVSAYSLTLSGSYRSLKDILFFAYSDPVGFKQKYVFPSNIIIRPSSGGVKKKGADEFFEFEMEVPSVGIRFTSEIRGYQLQKHEEIISERMLSGRGESKVSKRLVLQFAFPLEDGKTKVVFLEEIDAMDNKFHDIARTSMMKLNIARMRLFYDNYNR